MDTATTEPVTTDASATVEVRPSSSMPVDRINELYRGEIFTEETAQAARDRIHWMCSQCEGQVILDVGCSQGIASILLAREGFAVTAIDMHPESIAFARAEVSRESPTVQRRLTLLETDLESLPDDRAFDTILLGEVIEHQARPDRLLAAAKARLRPGGRLVVTTPFGLHPHADHKVSLFPSDLTALADRLALGIAHVEVDGSYMRCVMLERDTAGGQPNAAELLRLTQQATFKSQQGLFERLADRSEQLKKKSDSLRIAQRKLAEAQAKFELPLKTAEANASKLSLQLNSIRSEHEEAIASLKRAHAQELQARLTPEAAAALTRRVAELEAALAAAQAGHQVSLEAAHAEHRASLDAVQAEQHVAALTSKHELQLARDSSDRLRVALNDALTTLKATKAKNAYRLGETLAIGVKSPANLVALPGKIFSLWREVRASRHARADSGGTDDPVAALQSGGVATPHGRRDAARRAKASSSGGRASSLASKPGPQGLDLDKLRNLMKTGGAAAVKARLLDEGDRVDSDQLAFQMLQAGKAAGAAGDRHGDFAFAQLALTLSQSEKILRGFFWAAQRASRLEHACQAIRDLERLYGPQPKPDQLDVLDKLRRSPAYQLVALEWVVDKPTQPIVGIPGRICYVLHNSLPYSSGGYATRAQGVSGGLIAAGYEVVVVTRPGFPIDTKPELTADQVSLDETIDGVRFVRILDPQRTPGMPVLPYMQAAADAVEQRLRALRPSAVIAASNFRTALPALIAARRLGIPFIYEVRGFWEVTRISREPEYQDTPAYAAQVQLEARVAQLADHVFTLTGPMAEELVARGVPAHKIDLLPNSCDPQRFVPRARDEALAARLGIPAGTPIIGYIGTFVDYEGLEDLALACAILKERGQQFRLMLVGNENASGTDTGPITAEILRIAAVEGLSDWLIMPGRVPHDEVEAYYSLIDVAPFPRKPLPVCEMVSPMKPLEALAMEKAVLVSDVRALAELVHDGATGMHFRKGDIGSLVEMLQKLLLDPELRLKLGQAGRRWVATERTWKRVGDRVATVLARLTVPQPRPPEPSTTKSDPVNLPPWWNLVDPAFRDRCAYVDMRKWTTSPDVETLRRAYVARFDETAVAKRIPLANWSRADCCANVADGPESLLDVGSGLGEFVNLCKQRRPDRHITSVDVRNWDLWFDASGCLERVKGGLPALGDELARDTVTCFEVIEHLPPKDLPAAVATLRRLARRRLLISVPFMESLPLHRGHLTRFDADTLLEHFPDARFTILGKGERSDAVVAWILCELPGSGADTRP